MVAVISVYEYLGGTRWSGIVSSAADKLVISAVHGVSWWSV